MYLFSAKVYKDNVFGPDFEKVIEKYIDKIIDDTLTESFNRKAMDKPLITKENLEINGEIVKIQIKEI